MPEGFTYFDMQRRLAKAIPYKQLFKLKICEENARYKGTDEQSRSLHRQAKMEARKADPTLFIPDVEKTFPGLIQLPLDVRDRSFMLSGQDIKSRGKALGIPLSAGYWINIHLRMHGHVLAISHPELQEIERARAEEGRDTDQSQITIQLALINQNSQNPCIIIVDRIRLATMTFVKPVDDRQIWWSRKQGPCPITEWKDFELQFDNFAPKAAESEASIFAVITKRQDFFNGIGTSHANEILHLAIEHPGQKAKVIFSDHTRCENLKAAIAKFFSFAHSEKYQNAVPSSRSGGSAFSEPRYITRNIISLQQRVYGHTKAPTKISMHHYAVLFDRGLLDEKYQALGTPKRGRAERDSQQVSKKVQVYAIRFLNKTKKGIVRNGSFAYTVMCKSPPDSVAVRYEEKKVALRQALGNRRAEIGIASFTDNAPSRTLEIKQFKRRFPVKSGLRGRPRKSKNHKLESTRSTPTSSPSPSPSRGRKRTAEEMIDDANPNYKVRDNSRRFSGSVDERAYSSCEEHPSTATEDGESTDGVDDEIFSDGEEAQEVLEQAMREDSDSDSSAEEEDKVVHEMEIGEDDDLLPSVVIGHNQGS